MDVKRIESIDPRLREQIWNMAGKVEWDAEDWKLFHSHITACFLEIVMRRCPIPETPTTK